ncbi:hypothetical protein [Bradyrhizobium valentinum]|uniref:hypothetical protein n=1 Tax=Bradyrhizobium valentinum TaxID=1518501 RepID=UPI000AE69E69|nr:hypothetical protein [Bradyrhizobium valentinum]
MAHDAEGQHPSTVTASIAATSTWPCEHRAHAITSAARHHPRRVDHRRRRQQRASPITEAATP